MPATCLKLIFRWELQRAKYPHSLEHSSSLTMKSFAAISRTRVNDPKSNKLLDLDPSLPLVLKIIWSKWVWTQSHHKDRRSSPSPPLLTTINPSKDHLRLIHQLTFLFYMYWYICSFKICVMYMEDAGYNEKTHRLWPYCVSGERHILWQKAKHHSNKYIITNLA